MKPCERPYKISPKWSFEICGLPQKRYINYANALGVFCEKLDLTKFEMTPRLSMNVITCHLLTSVLSFRRRTTINSIQSIVRRKAGFSRDKSLSIRQLDSPARTGKPITIVKRWPQLNHISIPAFTLNAVSQSVIVPPVTLPMHH